MATNPIKYAEQELGVHQAYERAQAARQRFAKFAVTLNEANTAIRHIHEMMDDREQELVAEQRAANPEMSATAFKEHMKEVVHADESMKDFRKDLMDKQDSRDAAEISVEAAKYAMRVEAARLNELGGLLNFYAATKYATTQKRQDDK